MTINSQNIIYKTVISLLFIVQPFLTTWGSLATQVLKGRRNLAPFLAVLMCACLASIATSKFPESDLLGYFTAIDSATLHAPAQYFEKYPREPLYFGFLYFLGAAGLTSKAAFMFFSVFITLYITCKAIYRLGAATGTSENLILAVTAIAILYPSHFDLTGHLLRQMLAGSLMMLALTFSEKQGAHRVIWLLLALMIHYSVLLLVICAAIKAPRKLSPIAGLLAVVLVFLLSLLLARQFAPLALDIPYIQQIASRLVSAQGPQLESIPILHMALLFAAFASALYCRTIYRVNSELQSVEKILQTTIILCLFIFGASFVPGLSEIALRFYFYLYFLSPMILMLICQKHPAFRRPVQGLACFMPAVFLIGLQRSEWTYAMSGYDLFSPLWLFW